jgi:hypothetical protein
MIDRRSSSGMRLPVMMEIKPEALPVKGRIPYFGIGVENGE